MSEEVKDAPEAKADESQQNSGSEIKPSQSKKKKINRLTVDELNAKISKMEDNNQTLSVYYKNLVERKNKLTSSSEA